MVEMGIKCSVLFCGSKNNVCLVFTARQDSRLVHLKRLKQVLKSNVSTQDSSVLLLCETVNKQPIPSTRDN